jgi:hypothetical protein
VFVGAHIAQDVVVTQTDPAWPPGIWHDRIVDVETQLLFVGDGGGVRVGRSGRSGRSELFFDVVLVGSEDCFSVRFLLVVLGFSVRLSVLLDVVLSPLSPPLLVSGALVLVLKVVGFGVLEGLGLPQSGQSGNSDSGMSRP